MHTEYTTDRPSVALLAEGVDRNLPVQYGSVPGRVALLAEGVDRNTTCEGHQEGYPMVALLAEGVDRNTVWYMLVVIR